MYSLSKFTVPDTEKLIDEFQGEAEYQVGYEYDDFQATSMKIQDIPRDEPIILSLNFLYENYSRTGKPLYVPHYRIQVADTDSFEYNMEEQLEYNYMDLSELLVAPEMEELEVSMVFIGVHISGFLLQKLKRFQSQVDTITSVVCEWPPSIERVSHNGCETLRGHLPNLVELEVDVDEDYIIYSDLYEIDAPNLRCIITPFETIDF